MLFFSAQARLSPLSWPISQDGPSAQRPSPLLLPLSLTSRARASAVFFLPTVTKPDSNRASKTARSRFLRDSPRGSKPSYPIGLHDPLCIFLSIHALFSSPNSTSELPYESCRKQRNSRRRGPRSEVLKGRTQPRAELRVAPEKLPTPSPRSLLAFAEFYSVPNPSRRPSSAPLSRPPTPRALRCEIGV